MSLFCLSVGNYSQHSSVFSSSFYVKYIIQTFILRQLSYLFFYILTWQKIVYSPDKQLALQFSYEYHVSCITPIGTLCYETDFTIYFFSAKVSTSRKQWNYISDNSLYRSCSWKHQDRSQNHRTIYFGRDPQDHRVQPLP